MAMNGIPSMVRNLNHILCMQQRLCHPPCTVTCCIWDITEFLSSQSNDHAVLILNRPITQNTELINKLWNNAAVRVTVDGGATQWNKYVKNLPGNVQETLKMPDLVTGDFDSILPEVMEHYKTKGCEIIHTPDQNYTDFTKALMELNSQVCQEKIKINNVVAIAQCSGRIDHTLGNIQTLYLAKEKGIIKPDLKVYVISDDSITWLLCPGDHIISIPEDVRQCKKAWCSLVPIGEPCESVTSSGLKWNLDNQALKYGELVSTSNTFDGSKVVKIKCSHSLLWSMKVPALKPSP